MQSKTIVEESRIENPIRRVPADSLNALNFMSTFQETSHKTGICLHNRSGFLARRSVTWFLRVFKIRLTSTCRNPIRLLFCSCVTERESSRTIENQKKRKNSSEVHGLSFLRRNPGLRSSSFHVTADLKKSTRDFFLPYWRVTLSR
jgi:hypothetical protein